MLNKIEVIRKLVYRVDNFVVGSMMYYYFGSNWDIERFYYVFYRNVILDVRLFDCFFVCIFVWRNDFYDFIISIRGYWLIFDDLMINKNIYE